jgi:hypothetical protein
MAFTTPRERRMKTPAIAAALLLVLAACGGSPREPSEKDKALKRAIQAPQDKARALEGQLQQDEQRKREAVDANDG